MPPESPGSFVQTWQQMVLAIAVSAVLPLVGVIGALWLASQRAWRDAAVLALAAVIGLVVWLTILG